MGRGPNMQKNLCVNHQNQLIKTGPKICEVSYPVTSLPWEELALAQALGCPPCSGAAAAGAGEEKFQHVIPKCL